MTGDDLIDSEAAEEEERFWRSMYYRLVHKFNELKLNKKNVLCLCSQLDAGERALVRGMRSQVEKMMERYPEGCEEAEEEEEEEEEGEEEEGEDKDDEEEYEDGDEEEDEL